MNEHFAYGIRFRVQAGGVRTEMSYIITKWFLLKNYLNNILMWGIFAPPILFGIPQYLSFIKKHGNGGCYMIFERLINKWSLWDLFKEVCPYHRCMASDSFRY